MAKLEISKVHDAYAGGGECPLCFLKSAVERTYLLSFQGSRVMEPNVRVQTNKLGFCAEHYRRLYQGENKLGLALVVHTHFKEILPTVEKLLQEAASPSDRKKGADPLRSLVDFLTGLEGSCFICQMLAQDLERYAFTIVYLWKGDPAFLPVFRASRGFCIAHLPVVIAQARGTLRGKELEGFMKDLASLTRRSLESLEKELFQFTQLFRDDNRSLGSDEVRTALIRTLQKLSGGRAGGP